MDLAPFLRSVDILSDLTDEEIALLAGNSQYLEFTDGAPIIRLGEIGRYLWIVYEGEVEVTLPCPDGTEKPIAALERGAVLGEEMSIMTGEPAMASVLSGWSSKLIRIPRRSSPGSWRPIPRPWVRSPGSSPGGFSRTSGSWRSGKRPASPCGKHRPLRPEFLLRLRTDEDPGREQRQLLLKYSLFDTAARRPSWKGPWRRIGSGEAVHHVRTPETRKDLPAAGIATVGDALAVMLGALTDPEIKALGSLSGIDAVGHRVVHGGKWFSSSTVVSDEVKEAIRSCIPIAPLHNPFNIEESRPWRSCCRRSPRWPFSTRRSTRPCPKPPPPMPSPSPSAKRSRSGVTASTERTTASSP
jgi:acetate kinase